MGCVGWTAVSTQRARYPEHHPVPEVTLPQNAYTVTLGNHPPFVLWHFPGSAAKGCVTLLHGYFANRHQVFGIAAALQAQGWDCLVLELRGHGLRAGPFDFGKGEVQDARVLLQWVAEQPRLARLPHFLLGLSTGGYIALQWIEAYPGAFKAIVMDSVFSALQPMVGHLIREKYGLPTGLSWLTCAGLALSSQRWWWQWDPQALARTITLPVLAIHSQSDTRVPLTTAEAWYAAWAGPQERWTVTGCRHVECFKNQAQEYTKRVNAFFERHRNG
jgi:alpha-beta hydrolase superfamily lysophospholipase